MNASRSSASESIDAQTAITLIREYEFDIPDGDIKEVPDKPLQKWLQIFDPPGLVTQMLEWNRTPEPNQELRRGDEDCIGMIEAYMEYYSGRTIQDFLKIADLLDEGWPSRGKHLKFRIGKTILQEAERRGVEVETLECFVQAFLNIYNRNCMSGIHVRLRYVCLTMHSILEPLVSFSVTTSLKSALGDGGFLIGAHSTSLEAQHMALEWGRYMRQQLRQWVLACGQYSGSSTEARLRRQERAYRDGRMIFDLLWNELTKGAVYGNHLHRLLWNFGWEWEILDLFWSAVLLGLDEKLEEEGDELAETLKTTWYLYED